MKFINTEDLVLIFAHDNRSFLQQVSILSHEGSARLSIC